MRIGIDIHHLRLDQRGIYYYLWNTIQELCRIHPSQSLTLYLYGQPWMNDPQRLAHIRGSFPEAKLRHYWDGPTTRLLSPRFQSNGAKAPRWVRGIDRKVLLPIYRRALRFETRHPRRGRVVTWPWHNVPAAKAVDVFHHPAGLIFPVHPKANVMTIHDLIPLHDPGYNEEATTYFSESYGRANFMDLIIAVSQHTKADIEKFLGYPSDRIRVVAEAAHPRYRPISDGDVLGSVLSKYSLRKGEYILYVGAMERRKNVSRLVNAYARLKQLEPALQHRLVLAGGGDPAIAAEVKQLIAENQLAGHVTVLGYLPVEDLPSVLCGADLFVFPSLYEGFGLPPLEAMSCGTPVVASSTTSVPEVVGDAGLLIDPTNTEDLAHAMHKVLTDRALHRSLREMGLQRARRFSWKETSRLTSAAYQEAWDNWRRDGAKKKTIPRPTKYQTRLHEWVLEQTREHMHKGTFAEWSNNWP